MTPEQTLKLNEWTNVKLEVAVKAKPLIEREQVLRKEVTALFFPEPVEGANTLELEGGWKLKLTYKIDRKVDEALLDGIKVQLREMQVNTDTLINLKPSLAITAYRTLVELNPEAAKILEHALDIKPGSPTLELLPPK